MKYVPASFSSAFYDSTNFCLNSSSYFVIKPINPGPDRWILGSQDIYEMLLRKGVPAELYLDCDMEHGISGKSDFGLLNHSEPQVEDYFAARAATFFQAVMKNKADSLTTTKFVNCENYRNQCNIADNHASCSINAYPDFIR